MAYSASTPPRLVVPGLAGGPAIWTYASTDPSTGVQATGYFSNGAALGIKTGDILFSCVTSSGMAIATMTTVASSASTAAFGNLTST